MKKSIVITRIDNLDVLALASPLFLRLRPLASSLFSALSEKILKQQPSAPFWRFQEPVFVS